MSYTSIRKKGKQRTTDGFGSALCSGSVLKTRPGRKGEGDRSRRGKCFEEMQPFFSKCVTYSKTQHAPTHTQALGCDRIAGRGDGAFASSAKPTSGWAIRFGSEEVAQESAVQGRRGYGSPCRGKGGSRVAVGSGGVGSAALRYRQGLQW